MKKPEIHILNGPNLNLLGTREPEIYGTETLETIEQACLNKAELLQLTLIFEQTNSEGTLISQIQAARENAAGLIINPGAYTHTSVALFDTLSALNIPKIELHLTNPHTREPFRHHSYASPAVNGIICGFGASGYGLALDAVYGLTQAKDS